MILVRGKQKQANDRPNWKKTISMLKKPAPDREQACENFRSMELAGMVPVKISEAPNGPGSACENFTAANPGRMKAVKISEA